MIATVLGQQRLRAVHRLHARHLLAAQEQERASVARELHDDAVQRLALLGHELDAFGESVTTFSTAHRQSLSTIRGQLDALTEDLRELAHGLHPAMIEQVGLGATLAQLADDLGRTHGLQVHLELPEVPGKVPAAKAVALYRIAQEALGNVVRHAGTNQAFVALRDGVGDIELEIRDQGQGFEHHASSRHRGIGLLNIKERARLAGGSVAIRSQPGQGTTILVRMPREERPR